MTRGLCYVVVLYPIVDVDSLGVLGVPPVEFTRAVLAVSPTWIQLRAKSLPPSDVLALLAEMAPLCKRAGARLVVDDRPDLARLAGCDGVHVGQDDLSVDDVRRCCPELAVGVSTHDVSQLTEALRSRPDYVAVGPVFDTRTKRNADPVVGVQRLAECHRLATDSGIPLVAIGGITRDDIALVASRCDHVAVIGALIRGDVAACESAAVELAAAAQGALRVP